LNARKSGQIFGNDLGSDGGTESCEPEDPDCSSAEYGCETEDPDCGCSSWFDISGCATPCEDDDAPIVAKFGDKGAT